MKNADDLCFHSQCECSNRCGWTHCADDDIQMVSDFITSGELAKKLCFDQNAIFAMGNSNGGLLTWNLGQDKRTAPLLAGIASLIAAPHYGYNFPQADGTSVPVISLVGRSDPTHPVHTDNPEISFVTSTQYQGGYKFLTNHRITTTWAKGVSGCNVVNENQFPEREYVFPGLEQRLHCRTWCDGEAPHSLDCSYEGVHEDVPNGAPFPYEAVMMFFDKHLGMSGSPKLKLKLRKGTIIARPKILPAWTRTGHMFDSDKHGMDPRDKMGHL